MVSKKDKGKINFIMNVYQYFFGVLSISNKYYSNFTSSYGWEMYVCLRKHAVEYFFLTTSSSTVFWMFRMEVVYRLKYSNAFYIL